MSKSPQNPYESYMVSASAGCGKTYQLAHRFLFLVGAGAMPDEILTITFTKKAASEMQSRILEEAAQLELSAEAAVSFEGKLKVFREGALATTVPTCRSARETARLILGGVQSLRISTIDSLFMDWSKTIGLRFPDIVEHRSELFLADNREIESIRNAIWKKLGPTFVGEIAKFGEDGVQNFFRHIQRLDNMSGYLWLCQTLGGGKDPLVRYKLDMSASEIDDLWQKVILGCRGLAIDSGKQFTDLEIKVFADLQRLKILTKQNTLNKRTFGKKFCDENHVEIMNLEEMIVTYHNHVRMKDLNQKAEILYAIWKEYDGRVRKIKAQRGLVEFNDLLKICFKYFRSYGLGDIYFGIKHVMLDEFQDTSKLQWAVFRKVCHSCLGADNSAEQLAGTAFIVGDEKQSIYGFRESDPSIMDDAQKALRDKGLTPFPLNESYRSAQLIMDFTTKVFQFGLNDTTFPTHSTATFPGGKKASPDVSAVFLTPLFEKTDELKSVEVEAQALASLLKQKIYVDKLPVFDKASKAFRPLAAKDCAILYRTSTHAQVYEKALRDQGIDTLKWEEKGFFHRPEVADCMALLRLLAFQVDIVALSTLLKSPMGSVCDDDYLLILEKLKREKGSYALNLILDQLDEKYPNLVRALKGFIEPGLENTFNRFLTFFVEVDGYKSYLSTFGGKEGQLAAANLRKFADLILQLHNEGVSAPGDLLIKLLDKAKQDEVGVAKVNQNAVSLMTIHKSKGLEFPLVSLVDSEGSWEKEDQYWCKTETDDQPGVSYIGRKADQPSQNLAFERMLNKVSTDTYRESMRLFYVAITRARQYLVISGNRKSKAQGERHSFYQATKESLSALGAEELLPGNVSLEEELPEGGSCLQIYSEEFSNYKISSEMMSDRGANDKLIDEDVSIEPSSLDEIRYVRLPRITPSAKGEDVKPALGPFGPEIFPGAAKLAGTVLHECLEYEVLEENYQVENVLAKTLERLRLAGEAIPEKGHVSRIYEEVLACLGGVKTSASWGKVHIGTTECWTELPVTRHVDGHLIYGICDLVLRKDQELWIVDYKSHIGHEGGGKVSGSDLKKYYLEMGYDKQLETYRKALNGQFADLRLRTFVYSVCQDSLLEM